MKEKSKTAFILIFLISGAMFGQAWELIPNCGAVTSFHFLDENTGWVIRNSSELFFTADAGKGWACQIQMQPALEDEPPRFKDVFMVDHGVELTAVHFVDKKHGWVCTWNDGIYYTTDGGRSWNAHRGLAFPYRDVFFLSANKGWACGEDYTAVYSDDGGVNWNSEDFDIEGKYATPDFHKIYFYDTLVGMIAGAGAILKTTNAGRTWARDTSDEIGIVNDVFYLDPLRGWLACGYWTAERSSIIRTLNGGKSYDAWENSDCPILNGVVFIDSLRGFASGGQVQNDFNETKGMGCFYESADGGRTWKMIKEAGHIFGPMQRLGSGPILLNSSEGIYKLKL